MDEESENNADENSNKKHKRNTSESHLKEIANGKLEKQKLLERIADLENNMGKKVRNNFFYLI